MANIVVLVGGYYPYYSANGNVIRNIIDILKKDNNVKVISIKSKFNLSNLCDYEGYEIIRINEFWRCLHNYLYDKKIGSRGVSRWCYHYLLQIKRILFYISKLFRRTGLNKSIIQRYLCAIKKIDNISKIDIILPVSDPYESIVSAIQYKKQFNSHIKVIPFQLDHFSESTARNGLNILKKARYSKHIELEKECVKLSFCFLILSFIKTHYDMKIFQSFREKIIVCELPLIKVRNNNVSIDKKTFFNEKYINLVFAGTLNKQYRNPKYLLEILKHIPLKENVCMNILHFGNCDELINHYKKELRLINHGQVSLEESFDAMSNANILISIGVTNSNQLGSKLFDYFSFGKPIVHFYFFDKDPHLVYLKKYPFALTIKVDEQSLNENADKFLLFCKQYYNESIPIDKVREIFNEATPEYVANEITKRIN